MSGNRWWWRWLPFACAVIVACLLLIFADTSIADITRYGAYAILGVALPGTLVFRSLRRAPHTFVEDVAFGIATGLTLELAAWAVFSALDLRGFVQAWPLAVVVAFLAVPCLRKHWRVGAYPARPSLAWSWALAAAVTFFIGYVYVVFLSLNPVVPNTELTEQFLDLPYQLSLAAEAKHHIPLDVPQAAGEPLHYHWFSYVHMAMTSMMGGIDLPVVTLRFMVPAICALTAVLTAVVGWRLSGRPWVGVGAAFLFFVVGDFDFASAAWPPFGTQATFVIWPSLSMTFSWALLVALIGVVGDLLLPPAEDDSPPRFGPGAYVLVGLLAVASSASKASSLPVLGAGVALAVAAALIFSRRILWNAVAIGAIIALAQIFATVVIFDFQRYGLTVSPLWEHRGLWMPPADGRSTLKQTAVVLATLIAYPLHLQIRGAGIIALLWIRKGKLANVQWFLLGGAIAGPLLHVIIVGYAASWFGRAGFPFSVLLSAWGYALVLDRARLSARGKAALVGGAVAFAAVLTAFTWRYGVSVYSSAERTYGPIVPMIKWAGVLIVAGLVAAAVWYLARPKFAWLRGRGGLVVLTAILVAGAPGLIMDAKFSWGVPGGPYGAKALIPGSLADAARWVRARTESDEIIATNSHCARLQPKCDSPDSFWLSAYSERPVLIEGWAFAPRTQATSDKRFWDKELFGLNEDAFYAPTAEKLHRLRTEHGVRYLVVARDVAPESPALATLADLVYDGGRVAVYELPG